jgi:3-phosphoshikimate 1-carboxyvinyltransferase
MLRALGVTVRSEGTTVVVEPPAAPLPAFEIVVPADISSAAFPIVAAGLVPGSAISIRRTGVNPTRSGILDALARMGADIGQEEEPPAGSEPVATLHVRAAALQATTIAGDEIPRLIDELPILAVAATQAHGVTIVHDAAELRVKESDRIASLAAELRKMGARIEEFADGFAIEGPAALHGAVVETHRDHRLAMALAVAGLVAAGETIITGAECIDDSYPEFAATLAQMGAPL